MAIASIIETKERENAKNESLKQLRIMKSEATVMTINKIINEKDRIDNEFFMRIFCF